MGAQQKGQPGGIVTVEVEGVLHRPGGMVFGVVQSGKVGPVVFDLGAIGHIKPNGSKNRLNALPGFNHRMNRANAPASARQGDVDGFGGKPSGKGLLGEGLSAAYEGRFDRLFGLIDQGPLLFACLRVEGGEALEQVGKRPGLAQKPSLLVF